MNPQDLFTTFSDLIGEKIDVSWLDNPQKLRAMAIWTEKIINLKMRLKETIKKLEIDGNDE